MDAGTGSAALDHELPDPAGQQFAGHRRFGGVGVDEATGYWEAGAIAVGVGGPLFGDAGSGGDLAPMRERARGFVALATEFSRPRTESLR